MDVIEVRTKIKEIISNITSIPVDQIEDGASFRDDLDLDSLSLLEIGVDVDYAFKLGVPEERLQQLATVQDTVDLVLSHKAAQAVGA
ncbi:MAG: acyl carrier protein [Acidobacteria bacterium]|nr:acyl carrier protein [Acidobacteriota bacterium]